MYIFLATVGYYVYTEALIFEVFNVLYKKVSKRFVFLLLFVALQHYSTVFSIDYHT